MQLDYIENINTFGEDVIRLYDFDKTEARLLSNAILDNIINGKRPLLVDKLPFIKPRNCTLTMELASGEESIEQTGDKDFTCRLELASYKEMIYKIEPFCNKDTKGHQVITDLDSPIDILLSPAGTW